MRDFRLPLLVLLMPSWVSAQEPGSITGTATDLSGEVRLSGAIVRLLRAGDKTEVAGVRAGTDGQFRIEGVPPERYQLTIDVPGFRRFSIDRISISPGQHLSLPVLQLELGMCGNQRPGDASMSHIAAAPPESGIAISGTIARLPRDDRLRIRLELHREGYPAAKTTSDAKGNWRFGGIAPGTWLLTAHRIGYRKIEITYWNVPSGFDVVSELYLTRCPPWICAWPEPRPSCE